MGDYESVADAAAESVGEALAQVMAESGGGFVTGFCLVAEVIDSDGDRGWITATTEGQALSTTLGLLRWSTLAAEHDAVAAYMAVDDDDD